MRILLTGAASPLGRVTARMLIEHGHRVVGLARRFDGHTLIESLGAEAVMGDVRRPEQVAKGMSGCDAVVHVAGFFDFWEPARGIYESVNVDATRVVMAAARQAGARRVVL
ncbi:MAG TPA: NAD(P)H-binding protein, partial [Acidimicrobiales bacterium]|nr:NAD(P)H-binding protein [Acidimicrobiales bacterium]